MLIPNDVMITSKFIGLPGSLAVPSHAKGIVIFAHGSGSPRLSPRNRQVASQLNDAALGTLLFDLLTEEESSDHTYVFNIPFLANRLVMATRWLQNQTAYAHLPMGYFGASTGAAAALWAAADLKSEIFSVVSRGGRPDLAIPRLSQVSAPTLLIVGGHDGPVIEMNEEALKHLPIGNLAVVPGATHLFEEPGALEAVARYAAHWFMTCLENRNLNRAA